MALFAKKEAIGLDVGHGAAKAVHLVHDGTTLQAQRCFLLDVREEGILDESEMRAGVKTALGEIKCKGKALTIGIPQYLATTQISDFPPNVTGEELEGMVSFETMQLAGLSDESFCSDHHVMSPLFGRQNPVLIGVCRQSVIDEAMRNAAEDGNKVQDLGMNGIAVANTYLHLHPEALNEERPQILLDIGDENTTMLVLAAGQILFAGSLMFGASRYTDALKKSRQCSDDEAAKILETEKLSLDEPDSALMQAAGQLINEIRNGIEQWRAGEQPEVASRLLGGISLTGGGARLSGLPEVLGCVFGSEISVFGPMLQLGAEEEAVLHPELSAAFGLALQSLGIAAISISLSPESLRWMQLRKRRLPYLIVAEIIFAILLAFGMFRYDQNLVAERRRLEQENRRLSACKDLIPQLDDVNSQLDHYEKMLIPFVEKGGRAKRVIRSVEELVKARTEKDFFIYIGDSFSYEEGKPKKEDEAEAPPPREKSYASMMLGSLRDAEKNSEGEESDYTAVTEMEFMDSMVACGYVPYRVKDRYGAIIRLANKCKEGGFFLKPDTIPEPERVGREEMIFNNWERFWQAKPFKGRYSSFMLRFPFADLDVNTEAFEKPKEKDDK